MEEIIKLLTDEIQKAYKTLAQSDSIIYYSTYIAVLTSIKEVMKFPTEQQMAVLDSFIACANKELKKLKQPKE